MPRKSYKVTSPVKEVDPSKLKSDKSWGGRRILDNGRIDSSLPSQGTDWKTITSRIEPQKDGSEMVVVTCDGREIARYRPSSAGKIS